jgi:transcriptional regulator with XRE-family HTH domain
MARSKPLSPAQERARRTFTAIRQLRGYTHQQVAELAGVSRGFVESKSCGNAAIDVKDIELLAQALDVSEHVFLMEPAEAKMVVARADFEREPARKAVGADSPTIWYREPREGRHLARGRLTLVSSVAS